MKYEGAMLIGRDYFLRKPTFNKNILIISAFMVGTHSSEIYEICKQSFYGPLECVSTMKVRRIE